MISKCNRRSKFPPQNETFGWQFSEYTKNGFIKIHTIICA